jgi:hypothetical protein
MTHDQTKDFADASLSDRYADAYAVASAFITTGAIIKALGVVLAIVGAVVVMKNSPGNSPFVESLSASFRIFELLLCAVVGLGFWIAGIFITAHGQLLRALLDTAVNTSPLFSNSDKERMMGVA